MSPTLPDACIVEMLESPNPVFPVTPQTPLNQAARLENSQCLSGGKISTLKSPDFGGTYQTQKKKKEHFMHQRKFSHP